MFEVEAKEHELAIQWSRGTVATIPWLLLRDSCHCPECYVPNCEQKIYDSADIPLDVYARRLNVTDKRLVVHWSDNHRSEYNEDQLLGLVRSGAISKLPEMSLPGCSHWNDDMVQQFSRGFSSQDVMSDDSSLLACLSQLLEFGIVKVSGIVDYAGLEAMFDTIAGFVNETYFGRTFDLVTKPVEETDSVSFSRGALPMHTDIPYYTRPPEYQFLYASEMELRDGGTQFADGFKVANDLRHRSPELFAVLSTIEVTYRARYPWAKKIYHNQTPVISMDRAGRITNVVNNPTKMFFDSVPHHSLPGLFKAYKTFKEMLSNDEFHFDHKWKQGDLIVFDNRRIFHGRRSFEETPGKRTLRGGYFAAPEVTSRYLFLKGNAETQSTRIVA